MIVAVDKGRVSEFGTHDELMSKKGLYFQLVMLQTLAEEKVAELSELGSVLSSQEAGACMYVCLKKLKYICK